jgi:hypothetical protein
MVRPLFFGRLGSVRRAASLQRTSTPCVSSCKRDAPVGSAAQGPVRGRGTQSTTWRRTCRRDSSRNSSTPPRRLPRTRGRRKDALSERRPWERRRTGRTSGRTEVTPGWTLKDGFSRPAHKVYMQQIAHNEKMNSFTFNCNMSNGSTWKCEDPSLPFQPYLARVCRDRSKPQALSPHWHLDAASGLLPPRRDLARMQASVGLGSRSRCCLTT